MKKVNALFLLTDHTQPYYVCIHIPIASALVQTPLTRSFLKLIQSLPEETWARSGRSLPLPALHPSIPSIQSKHSNPKLQIKPALPLFFSSLSLCIFFLFYLYSGTFQRILVMIRSNKSNDCYVLYILLVLRGDLSDDGPLGPPQECWGWPPIQGVLFQLLLLTILFCYCVLIPW